MNGSLPNPEERRRMVDAALKDSGFLDRHAVKEPTDPASQAMVRAGKVTEALWKILDSVVRADAKTKGKFNETAFWNLAFKMTQENFRDWNKDELLVLVAVVHSEFLLEKAKELAIHL